MKNLSRNGDLLGKSQPDEEIAVEVRSSAAEAAASAPAGDGTLPVAHSAALSLVYITTSMSFFLLIRYSKSNANPQEPPYDSSILMLLVELVKLSVSVALKYREDGDFLPYTLLCSGDRRRMWLDGLPYAVPSLLYAVYNNLTFVNLNLYDPGTYQVFMQTRIIFTGILFTVVLHHALTARKWVALVLLMLGVASKYFSPSAIHWSGAIFLVLLQAMLSSLAGVYNEHVLKRDSYLSIHQQNFFMYLYAIFFNALIGVVTNPALYLRGDWRSVMHPIFVPIVLLGATMGLSAAFILKFINVIVKAFASAVEVLLTAVAAAVLLGEPLQVQDVLAAAVVTVAVYVYYTRGWGDHKYIRCGTGDTKPITTRAAMETSARYLSRMRTSILHLLLLEYLYSFSLDGSLLVLLYRYMFYADLLPPTEMTSTDAIMGSSSREDPRGDPQNGRTRIRGAAQANTSNRRADPSASRSGANRTFADLVQESIRGDAASADASNEADGPNAPATRAQFIFVAVLWRLVVVGALHTWWFGSHYWYATRSSSPAPLATPPRDVTRAGEFFFWTSMTSSVHFLYFTAAWEPFSPLPCVLLVVDAVVFVLELLLALLKTSTAETLTVLPKRRAAAAGGAASGTSLPASATAVEMSSREALRALPQPAAPAEGPKNSEDGDGSADLCGDRTALHSLSARQSWYAALPANGAVERSAANGARRRRRAASSCGSSIRRWLFEGWTWRLVVLRPADPGESESIY